MYLNNFVYTFFTQLAFGVLLKFKGLSKILWFEIEICSRIPHNIPVHASTDNTRFKLHNKDLASVQLNSIWGLLRPLGSTVHDLSVFVWLCGATVVGALKCWNKMPNNAKAFPAYRCLSPTPPPFVSQSTYTDQKKKRTFWVRFCFHTVARLTCPQLVWFFGATRGWVGGGTGPAQNSLQHFQAY